MKDSKISRRSVMKAGLGAVTTGLVHTPPWAIIEEEHADHAGSRETPDGVRKKPIDCVNVLFGTASLDDRSLLGNAPPHGEELYTGMACPGAALPHGVDVSPVNKDVSLAYPHGNLYSYAYPRRTMVGFSCMVD